MLQECSGMGEWDELLGGPQQGGTGGVGFAGGGTAARVATAMKGKQPKRLQVRVWEWTWQQQLRQEARSATASTGQACWFACMPNGAGSMAAACTQLCMPAPMAPAVAVVKAHRPGRQAIPAACTSLQVIGEELDEATLQQVLLACLAAARHGQPTLGKCKEQAGSSSMWDARLPGGGAGEPSAEEVAAAAHYVIERFGSRVAGEEGAQEQGASDSEVCVARGWG